MKMLMIGTLALLSLSAVAEINCTSEAKEKWKDETAFKKELEITYKIKKFKVTKGNCYEIYGHDKAGKKVEIYFNPVTGAKVKENIE